MKTISIPYYCTKTKRNLTLPVPTVTQQQGLAVTPMLSMERMDAYEKDGTVLPLPSRVKGEDPPRWVVTHIASGKTCRPSQPSKEKAKRDLIKLLSTGIDYHQAEDVVTTSKNHRKIRRAFARLSFLQTCLLDAVQGKEGGVPAGREGRSYTRQTEPENNALVTLASEAKEIAAKVAVIPKADRKTYLAQADEARQQFVTQQKKLGDLVKNAGSRSRVTIADATSEITFLQKALTRELQAMIA